VGSVLQSAEVERAVEEAIKKGLEEMLGSRLGDAFYTTLVNFVKVLRGHHSLLERPELIVMFLRRNFREASPKYEERIAGLIEEELRGSRLGNCECKHGKREGLLLLLKAWLQAVRRGEGLEKGVKRSWRLRRSMRASRASWARALPRRSTATSRRE